MAANDTTQSANVIFAPFPGHFPNPNDGNERNFNMDIQKYIERLDLDRRESEQRIREERRESERRYQEQRREDEMRRREFEERLERRFEAIDKRFDNMDAKIESLTIEVRKDGKENRRWLVGTFIAVAAIAVTTVIGIVSIALSVI